VTAAVIDGKAVAAALRAKIKAEAAGLAQKPGLSVVLVGDDPASAIYVRNKEKAALEAGFNGQTLRLPATASQAEVLALVARLNNDPVVHGILVQMPLPAQVDEDIIARAISPAKDVDGLHPENIGLLAAGQPFLAPCTPTGCILLLKHAGIELRGKHAVVIGRSHLVGRPVAQMLLKEDCTVTICHSRTQDMPSLVRQADIVIAAAGKPRLVKADWIKKGAAVVDVGINRLDDGTICGDVDYEAVRAVAGYITPVPGGVGPMTIACLLANTLAAAKVR
jgi:methylenetetrahydrofolate dehydrogenase (NADP+) / methenyltetrahydrofolate cyclohydrolase